MFIKFRFFSSESSLMKLNEKLPEDQSLDNMLDNYATEIIPNYFFISSYDALPEFMGSMDCKSSAKSGLILVKTKRVFSKSLILNYYENT